MAYTRAASSTMMQDLVLMMQTLASFAGCSKRKQPAKQSKLVAVAFAQNAGKAKKGRAGVGSTSDGSTSAGGSGTECRAALAPPPGLCAPPGLEQPVSLNAQAKAFVPSSAAVRAAVNDNLCIPEEQYNGYAQAPWAKLPMHQGACAPVAPAAPSLYDVMNKLSSQDAATVLSALNKAHSDEPLRPPPTTLRRTDAADNRRRFNENSLPRDARQQPPPGTFGTSQQRQQVRVDHDGLVPGANSLRENLAQLSLADPKCVILVKKIGKLGLNSAQLLEIYFSRFGPVDKVLVSHAIDKGPAHNGHARSQSRLRPAATGFVVMSKAESAAAAMEFGGEHTVLNGLINVGPYVDHRAAAAAAEAAGAAGAAGAAEFQ